MNYPTRYHMLLDFLYNQPTWIHRKCLFGIVGVVWDRTGELLILLTMENTVSEAVETLFFRLVAKLRRIRSNISSDDHPSGRSLLWRPRFKSPF